VQESRALAFFTDNDLTKRRKETHLMKIEETIDLLWQATQRGAPPPAALQKTLTFADAYRVQLGILARWQARGEKIDGWKIGLSADAARKMFGLDAPIAGYLLASRHFPSGHTITHAALRRPIIESELCFTMGKRLAGPGVTREQVLASVAAVAPAFEVVDMRTDMGADMPLGIADDVAQWGYVTGVALTPYPTSLDLGEVTAEMRRNGEIVAQVRGQAVIDNQLDSIAWLANHLAEYGMVLEAGQHIMSGSFTRPTPIAKGDQWETRFSSVGTVSAAFV
jgi:2-keto-4-pentenoate hydratase